MLNRVMRQKLFALTELNHLRHEAMQIFEQSLTQGDLAPMISFIEEQLIHEPPRLQLLREITDDLQQRLLSLRAYHFDVRERVVSTLHDTYGVDISPLAPQAQLDRYHHLTQDALLAYVQDQNPALEKRERLLIRKMIDASLQMAVQLYNDIQLTTHLFNLVLDWTEAISASIARQHWPVSTRAAKEDAEQDSHLIQH